jgi:hypothetical protein
VRRFDSCSPEPSKRRRISLVRLASMPPPYATSISPGICLKEECLPSSFLAFLSSASGFWGTPSGTNPSRGLGKKAACAGVTVPNACEIRVLHASGRLPSGRAHSALAQRPMSSFMIALGVSQSGSHRGSSRKSTAVCHVYDPPKLSTAHFRKPSVLGSPFRVLARRPAWVSPANLNQ